MSPDVQLAARSVPWSALTDVELAAWRRLQAEDPALASPYFTPEFAAAVARVRPDVRVAVLADGRGPCAFLPHQRRGRVAYPLAGSFSDFQALIAERGLEWTADDLLRAAGAHSFRFDHWLASQAPAAAAAERTAPSPYADLSRGYDAYLADIAARSDQMVKVGQRRRKIAREHGPTRFELRSRDASALEQVIEWKAEQFRRTQLPDPFAHAWARDLLHDLLCTDGDALAGWLSTLHVGDRLVAAHMGMRCRTVLHYWFPVYDHAFHQYGPGLLLLTEILQAASRAGIERVDFGKGEDAWKPRFMSGTTAVVEGCLERAGLRAGWRRVHRSLVDSLRRSPLRRFGAWPARRLRRLVAARRLRLHG
ncbi:MAG: GNAT family N-acetyltransferase [Planctomycetota bacterium]